MSRIAASGQRVIILSCLVVAPLLFVPQALDPFVLPKWFVVKLAGLLLLVFSLFDMRNRAKPLFAAPLDFGALMLLLAFGIASLRTPGTWTGLQTPTQLLALWVIYRAIALGDLSQKPKKLCVATLAPAFALSLTPVVLVACADTAASFAFSAALLGHSNYAGQWAVLVTPVFVAFCLTARGWVRRTSAAVSLGLCLCYLLISGCRGAWVALVAATSIVVIARWHWVANKVPRRRLLLLAAIVAVAILASWHTGFLEQRLLSSFGRADTGIRFRVLAWDSTLKMIAREPIWGVGAGGFAAYYPRYRAVEERSLFPQRRFVASPHNSYLLAAAEAGPLGMIAILVLAITSLRLALSPYKRLSPSDQVLRTAAGVGVVATLIHTGVSFNLESPVSALYFWAFAGMLSAHGRTSRPAAIVSRQRHPIRAALMLLAIMLLTVAVFADAKRIMASIHAPAGSEFKRRGELSKAEQELEAAVRIWPESPNVCHLLARVMLQKGDLDACERLNKKALELWPHFRDALLDVGIVKWRQNKLEEARRFMDRSIEIDPAFTRGRIALGNLLATQQDYGAAIEQYRHALKQGSSRDKACYYIAAARAAQGRPEEALDAMNGILIFKHMLLDWRLSMSVKADYLIDVLGHGEKTFRVVVRDGDLWPVWQSKTSGIAHIDASPPRIEVSSVPEGVAIRVSPDGESALLQFSKCPDSRARVYSIVVDGGGARNSFDLWADPTFYSQALLLAGRILSSLDRADEAEAMWRESLRLDPENAQARQLLEVH